MTTYFISDLHLESTRPEITRLFLDFLNNKASQAEALYILGDFFEVWIGDDYVTPLSQEITHALATFTKIHPVPIYLMHGNRDFLIGKRFLRETGCKLLTDPTVINLYGTPTLLMHGDTLCTRDTDYLKFRKKVRNPFVQKLFLWKSLNKRIAIAENYRAHSKNHTQMKAENIMDVSQDAVESILKKYKVTQLIHGHTHRPHIHQFVLDKNNAQRIVLGAWDQTSTILVCDSKEMKLEIL